MTAPCRGGTRKMDYPKTTYRAVVLAVLLMPASSPTFAGEFDLTAVVAGEARLFPSEPAYSDQDNVTLSPSFSFQPSLYYDWNDGRDRLTFAPFGRWDPGDERRTHWDLREANWLHVGEGWDFVLGVGRVFWGVTESRHLVDIINQDDQVEDIDGEDKLGQPMLNINLIRDWGRVSVFVLPGFRERTFPGNEARLRGPLPIIADDPVYTEGAGRHQFDFAARWAHSIGNWDVGLAHFRGTGREPRLVQTLGSGGRSKFVPYYDQINQISLDLQLTRGAWLWKLEMMTRSGQGPRFFAAVAGFEYTLFGLFGTPYDLGLLSEYLYDGRDNDKAPFTAFEDDFFLGARLALNDFQDTTALFGGVIDRETGGTAIFLEAERRIGETWRIELEGRFFSNVSNLDPLSYIHRDDHITFRLSKYF